MAQEEAISYKTHRPSHKEQYRKNSKYSGEILRRRIKSKIEDICNRDQLDLERKRNQGCKKGAENNIIDWQKAFLCVSWTKLMQMEKTGIAWR